MGLALSLLAMAGATQGVPHGTPSSRAQPAAPAFQHSPVFAARGSATGYATVTILRAVEVGPGRPAPGKGMTPRLVTASGPGNSAQQVLAYEFE
ncbi:hypothetical protein ABDK56_08680 [Sphingomonas sp. ASV193]|uniref:hypothetical protein n=1 Tax=Sphingomonas sp. ASV193 TaxID=3144405 RepID=UPI0032E9082A